MQVLLSKHQERKKVCWLNWRNPTEVLWLYKFRGNFNKKCFKARVIKSFILQLISSVKYSSVVCKPCLAGIDERLKYKEHLVENQKYLYSKIYPHELVSIKEEPTETFTIKTEMRTCEVSSVKTEPCEPSEFSNDAEDFEPEPSSPTSDDHIKCEICSKMLKTGATFKRHVRHILSFFQNSDFNEIFSSQSNNFVVKIYQSKKALKSPPIRSIVNIARSFFRNSK